MQSMSRSHCILVFSFVIIFHCSYSIGAHADDKSFKPIQPTTDSTSPKNHFPATTSLSAISRDTIAMDKTPSQIVYVATPVGPVSPATPLWLPVFDKGIFLNVRIK